MLFPPSYVFLLHDSTETIVPRVALNQPCEIRPVRWSYYKKQNSARCQQAGFYQRKLIKTQWKTRNEEQFFQSSIYSFCLKNLKRPWWWQQKLQTILVALSVTKKRRKAKLCFCHFPNTWTTFTVIVFFFPRFLAVGMVRLIMPSSKVWLFPFS